MIVFKNLNKYQVINGITNKDFGSIGISSKSVFKLANLISKYSNKEINYKNIIFAQQMHGSNIHICYKKDKLCTNVNIIHNKGKIIPKVDGLLTRKPGLVLVIRTADCVPVLFFDPRGKIVAAVHAGRKGLLDNIIPKTINTLKNKFHCIPKDILVGIGPFIKKCCYNVNFNIKNEVKKIYPNDWKKFFQKRNNKIYLDLGEITYKQLLNSGIKKENIEDINLCTSCQNDLFFSYRKGKTIKEKSQRIATFIGM